MARRKQAGTPEPKAGKTKRRSPEADGTEIVGTLFEKPSDTELVATRTFDASREVVFNAWTNPEHVPNWMLGPGDWTMPVCEIDLREGGEWHFVWRGPDGEDMEMRGEYVEVDPPKRLVNTEDWGEDWPETVNEVVFTDEDGVTKTVSTVTYPSKETREKAIETGMLEGWAQSYDRLDTYLRSLEG